MKKLILLASLAVTTALFTGCGGGGGGGGGIAPAPVPPPVAFDVLYLDDAALNGIAGVPYDCPSGAGVTDGDGAFQFVAGENCTFDLRGYDGTVIFADFLYIDFADGTGVADIGYDCISGTGGFTDFQGNFVYDEDDECTFYL